MAVGTARFVSDLVGNPEDRFSHNEAHMRKHTFSRVVPTRSFTPMFISAFLKKRSRFHVSASMIKYLLSLSKTQIAGKVKLLWEHHYFFCFIFYFLFFYLLLRRSISDHYLRSCGYVTCSRPQRTANGGLEPGTSRPKVLGFTTAPVRFNTCVPAPKCGRRLHFGTVGIAGLYIGRLRNCLPFLTSFTQRRMANLHIKSFNINAYQ